MAANEFDTFFKNGLTPLEEKKPDPFDDFLSTNEGKVEYDSLYAPYYEAMEEYKYHSESGEWTFFENDPDQGYKFHLNVLPENVLKVSSILKAMDVEHKYLEGGAVEDGKVFTVYSGSKDQTEQIVSEVLNSEISNYLESPIASGEVPYGKNIVGRFVGNRDYFLTKIPANGITILRNTEGLDPEEAYLLADSALQRQYGDYYGGGISYEM